jgi:hypothetical protein
MTLFTKPEGVGYNYCIEEAQAKGGCPILALASSVLHSVRCGNTSY